MKRFDLLTMLLYGLDIASRPTLNNLFMGYESWLHYNRLHPSQLSKLKTGGLVEKSRAGDGASWALRLTEKGRLKALGGRDPESRWARSWDGLWRLLMFDIPQGNDRARRKLYNWLRGNHFGCLQKSVWISPDPVAEVSEVLGSEQAPSARVVAIEGHATVHRPETDAEFVKLAWPQDEINGRYREYMNFTEAGVPAKARPATARDWVGEEHTLWARAVEIDPLLPGELLPRGYLGKRAWQARRRLLKKAAPMAIALAEK